MGFWPSLWAAAPADGAPPPPPPGRSARARCWAARDDYFRCLDRIAVVDSLAEADRAARACGGPGAAFDASCASSWVVYFKKRRVVERRKAEQLRRLRDEGAEGLPLAGGPPPAAVGGLR